MLKEILETRFMVKREMKELKKRQSGTVLYRVLEARQLAIKLLANVTCKYRVVYCKYCIYCMYCIPVSTVCLYVLHVLYLLHDSMYFKFKDGVCTYPIMKYSKFDELGSTLHHTTRK